MALRVDEERRRIEAGVGDLVGAGEDDPFAGRASFARLLAGTRAHSAYARRGSAADPSFQSEVVVRGEVPVEGWILALHGRVDAIREVGGRTVVEEVKTTVLDEAGFAALGAESCPAYVLQLCIYLYLLSPPGPVDGAGGPEVAGRLVFINLPGEEERVLEVALDRGEVHRFLAARVHDLLAAFATSKESAARRRRLAAGLAFPFPSRRPFQADMEEDCRRAFDAGECLLVSAPPGLGKTAAALGAALRHALASGRSVYFLTSKTTEQRIVQTTLARLAEANPGLTAVLLRAKAKICANEVVFCHPDFCEHARDYPAKVAAGSPRERLLARGLVLPDSVYDEGVASRVCPFQLSVDLSERVDVVVGDYNYVFDPAVALHRAEGTGALAGRVLVIDEAHNLLERARQYHSAEIGSVRLLELLAEVQVRPGEVHRALEDWIDSVPGFLAKLRGAAEDAEPLVDPAGGPPRFAAAKEDDFFARRRAELEGLLLDYAAWRKRAAGGICPEDPVLEAAYGFLRFARVLDLAGDESVFLVEAGRDGETVYRVVCLDPSPHLARTMGAFHGVVAMSATLEPEAYYRDLLGFPADRTSSARYPSPFAAGNRRVLVVPTIETTYRSRPRWYDRAARTIREVVQAHPGHWVAFLPSFEYLRQVESRIGAVDGELLVQGEGMRDGERESILARLERPDGTPRLLLAVLGGSFAEGVDLPGEALVGVIVVSPGLPRLSLERELLRRRFDERLAAGAGFDYAYLIPGLGRVVQAAGRLVRSESDRGVVVLLDRRFAQPAYTRYLPRDWYRQDPEELVVDDPAREVAGFFAGR